MYEYQNVKNICWITKCCFPRPSS